MDTLTDLIEHTLIELHIPPSLRGYQYLAYSIEQVAVDPLRIHGITKDLYQEIAHSRGKTWKAVERSVRTAISTCWNRGGREKLDEVVGYHLIERPCAAEFISLVANYIRRVQYQ